MTETENDIIRDCEKHMLEEAKELASTVSGCHIVNAFVCSGVSVVVIVRYKAKPHRRELGTYDLTYSEADIFVTQPIPADELPAGIHTDDPHFVHRSSKCLFTASASDGREYAFRCVHIPWLEDYMHSIFYGADDMPQTEELDHVSDYQLYCLNDAAFYNPYTRESYSRKATLDNVLMNAGRLADLGETPMIAQPIANAASYGFDLCPDIYSGGPSIAPTEKNAKRMSELLSGYFLIGGDKRPDTANVLHIKAVPSHRSVVLEMGTKPVNAFGIYIDRTELIQFSPEGRQCGGSLITPRRPCSLSFRTTYGDMKKLCGGVWSLRDIEDLGLINVAYPAAGPVRCDQLVSRLYDLNFVYAYVAPWNGRGTKCTLDFAFELLDEVTRGTLKLSVDPDTDDVIVLDGGQCEALEKSLCEHQKNYVTY